MLSSLPKSSTVIDDKLPAWKAAINRLQFQQRTCVTFIPREVDNDFCVCNQHKSVHEDSTIKSDHRNEVWSWKRHTKEEPTIVYGCLPQSKSPYLRCSIKTDLDQLCLVLLSIWDMHLPGLIIRIISDTSSLLNVKLEKAVLKGIADAATASNACIITNTYKEDTISQLIGEVVYKSRVKNPQINFRAVGIGKWGNIPDPSIIESKYNITDHLLKFSPMHNIENIDENTKYHTTLARYTLEPNLTQYIFFDDGTHGSMDTGDFASKLAIHISNGTRRKIPLLAILAGADLHALKSIFNYVYNNIPVVIIDQSGPLATLLYLAESIEHDKMDKYSFKQMPRGKILEEILNVFGEIRSDILKDVRKLYESIRQKEYLLIGTKISTSELLDLHEEDKFAQYLYWFAICLKLPFRNRMHVFDMNLSDRLENKIYDAMVQARESHSQNTTNHANAVDEQIRLALRWNVANVTENHLLINTINWKDPKKMKDNRRLILDALSKNLVVFVSNFSKLGIDLASLFVSTADSKQNNTDTSWNTYLKELYTSTMRKNTDSLYLLERIDEKLISEKGIYLGQILKILVGDFMEPLYHHKISSNQQKVIPEISNSQTDSEYIYRDLFLWCILTHRLDMAKFFLSQLKIRICSALIASKILKSLISYAPDQHSKDKLNDEADDFEMYAIECIRCSYLYDREQVCELIIRQVDLYGKVTCLQVAIAAENKKFLNEDACDALLTKIWFDKIDSTRERTSLIMALQTTKQSINERPLAKNGINYGDDYHIDESTFKNFKHFHNRPFVKYCYTCFGYILFLMFFSYYMLYAFNPSSDSTPDIHWTEILTIIFVSTMLIEDIRQFYFQDGLSWKRKFLSHFDVMNRSSNLFLVIPAYLLFYVGLILRFILKDTETFGAARIVLAYDLELWFIRSILFIGIFRLLGPKLVMIRKMANDMLFFSFIIVVFILGYGIRSRAMIAYNTFPFDGREFFAKIVYPVYYFILGNIGDELSTLNETPNASTTIATQVLFAFHMLFVNILLVNLLIALFNFTITNIQEQARYIWAYDRCGLVRDYYGRPALFPPLTFLISLVDFGKWCLSKCSIINKEKRYFKMIPANDSVDKAWSEFERYSTNDYVRHLFDAQIAAASNIITTDVSFEAMSKNTNESNQQKFDTNQLNVALTRIHMETNEKLLSMHSNISDRVDNIDARLDKLIDSMDWIMTAMARVKMSREDPPYSKQKKSETFVTNQEEQQPTNNTEDNQSPSKPKTPVVSETRLDMQNESNNKQNVLGKVYMGLEWSSGGE
ncbi:hypothetical protein I4U23_022435, partial [Adineta vaga]